MNLKRSIDPIAAAVVAYCDAVDVPDFDATAVVSWRRKHTFKRERPREKPLRIAASLAAMLALLFVAFNISAVVAEVERVFQAVTVTAGRMTPMTIRVVNIERARADMPFAVIEPPSIPGAPIVTVEEIYGDASRSNPSVIFEIHGAAPGREVMIVENTAARQLAPTLLTVRGPGEKEIPRLHSLEPRISPGRRAPTTVLHGSFAGEAFTPTTWVTQGTRIAVMSPPSFLTDSQMRAIRRAMSR